MGFDMMFTPCKIGSLTVKNRIIMEPAEVNFGQPTGTPTKRLIDYYVKRADGGVGLIFPGICRVNDWYSISDFGQLAMCHDWQIAPMKELVDEIHKHGAKMGLQLHHPGRQGYSLVCNFLPFVEPLERFRPGTLQKLFKQMTPVLESPLVDMDTLTIFPVQAPSKVEKSYHVSPVNRAMTHHEVKSTIQDFIDAAVRCKKAGVDVVELHGTHGYLIQQFLSPNTNKRKDEYGGSFENRMRFLDEIVLGIKEACGQDYPVMVRLTVDEMYDRIGKPDKGYGLEEGKRIAQHLETIGVDAIDVSSASYDAYNYWLEPTTFEPGWRAYLAKEIKSVVHIPVSAANFIRSPEQAERQLEEGYQDFVGSARNFLSDPDWANKAKAGNTQAIRRCIGCLYCINSFTDHAGVHFGEGLGCECALNPALGFEAKDAAIPQDSKGKTAVVVGAGPAGLKAAETLARRGFSVTVLEKDSKPGGQVQIASKPELHKKLSWCIEDLMTSIKNLGVTVKLETEANEDDILALNPDVVIIATGGVPVAPRSIGGVNGPNVYTSTDIIMGDVKVQNKKVAVIGSGMTGLETAEELRKEGNHVTVVEMAGKIAPGTWFQLVDDSMSRLRQTDTTFMTGARLMKITDNTIVVEHTENSRLETIPVDTVVLAMGVRPVNSLASQLKDKVKVVTAGDAQKSGPIASAVHSGYRAALSV